MLTFISNSPEETKEFAAGLASKLRSGDVIAYEGGLGAGKTTFTAGLAHGLGITQRVSSPTFALVNEYEGKGVTLCHFDMYRIESFDDLYSTGFFDYLDGGCILAVEWSENISGALPPDTIFVELVPIDEDKRRITVKGARF